MRAPDPSNLITHYSNHTISIHSKSSSFLDINTQYEKIALEIDTNESPVKRDPICHFCDSDEISLDNILIRPCKCKTYIHLQCYRSLLKKTMLAEFLKDMVLINNKSLICNKCQTQQMLAMNFCNAKKDLLDLKYFKYYLILQSDEELTYIINLEKYNDIYIVRNNVFLK